MLSISNSFEKSSSVSIISKVTVDFPLAVSPAIPRDALLGIIPDKNMAAFLIISGLYLKIAGTSFSISF